MEGNDGETEAEPIPRGAVVQAAERFEQAGNRVRFDTRSGVGHGEPGVFIGRGVPPGELPPAGIKVRAGEGRLSRRGERGDVVRALVAPGVDEEGRGSGDATEVGRVDVLGDPGAGLAFGQLFAETVHVQAELFDVAEHHLPVHRARPASGTGPRTVMAARTRSSPGCRSSPTSR
jgi:hypothetical protein